METHIMLEKTPSTEEMESLIGVNGFKVWTDLCAVIDRLYDVDQMWNNGGKAWKYEYKYRRGGKTLCALYARENCFGLMIIFGKDERDKFEADRPNYSIEVQRIYDEAAIYHDGKWVMFVLEDTSMFDDLVKLLAIKRRPNKK
jgi:hypothetical protein